MDLELDDARLISAMMDRQMNENRSVESEIMNSGLNFWNGVTRQLFTLTNENIEEVKQKKLHNPFSIFVFNFFCIWFFFFIFCFGMKKLSNERRGEERNTTKVYCHLTRL